MNKKIQYAVLGSFISISISIAHASEIEADLGMFPLSSCANFNPSTGPRLNQFRQRQATVKARVLIQPSSDNAVAITQTCINEAKVALRENQSNANMQLFWEVFQHYLNSCAAKRDPAIHVRAILLSDNQCVK